MKAIRVAGAYEEKRRIAASKAPQDQPFTRMLPGWLRWNEQAKRHEAVEERATLLRDIFGKADAGWSKHRIARYLNEARVEPWGRGKRKGTHWHSSYIQKLLTNTAVIGTFTPHRVIKSATGRTRQPQQPIEEYFPVVVDQDVFARVSAQAKGTSCAWDVMRTVHPSPSLLELLRCGPVWGHRNPRLQGKRWRRLRPISFAPKRTRGPDVNIGRCAVMMLRRLLLRKAKVACGAKHPEDETPERLKRKSSQAHNRSLGIDRSGARSWQT